MNAPLVEVLIRLLVAVTATGVAVLLYRSQDEPRLPARPLMWFLTGSVILIALWRWFILWLGFQSPDFRGLDGFLPYVQPINGALLFLLLLANGLLAWFHVRHRGSHE